LRHHINGKTCIRAQMGLRPNTGENANGGYWLSTACAAVPSAAIGSRLAVLSTSGY
jgi:hypothetical protein